MPQEITYYFVLLNQTSLCIGLTLFTYVEIKLLNPPDHLLFIKDDLTTEKVNGLEIWKPAEIVLMTFFHRGLTFYSRSAPLCCFKSVTHGFLIKILGLLLVGKNTWTFAEHEIKEEAVQHHSFKKKWQRFSQDAIYFSVRTVINHLYRGWLGAISEHLQKHD